MKRALPFLLASLLAAPAHAEVWTDPSLEEALKKAELVVRAKAPEEGSSGEETVSFTVLAALKGEVPEGPITVGGLHDPTRTSGPVFKPGAQVLLVLLRGDDGQWKVPTPTFGRYPIREGKVLYATLRDTYLRLNLPLGDFARFVGLHLGKRDTAWLEQLRAELPQADFAAKGDALARLYLTLESLALAGEEDDAPAVARCLDPSAPFQLRISACRALAGVLGKRAAGRLLTVASEDPEPAVRTSAVGLLGRLDPPPAGLVKKLVELLPEATAEAVRFSRPTDPRLNKWPSPKAALLRVIGRRGAGPAKADILQVIRTTQPEEVFTAALKALITLKGDPELPGELVGCFRADQEIGSKVYNRELCAALSLITGKKIGDDPDAWRRWVEERGG